MMAGAFALNKDKNGKYGYYYGKTVMSFGIPVAVFSIIYLLYNIMLAVLSADNAKLLGSIKNFLVGAPHFHMWYLYMMIPLYILVPVIIMWKNSISEKKYNCICALLMVVCIISGFSSEHVFNWDIGFSACYIGYFLLGGVIYKICHQSKLGTAKRNFIGIGCVCIGLLLEILPMVYRMNLDKQQSVYELNDIVGPFNPIIAIVSILIFFGFSLMKLSFNLSWLAKHTFLIYLIHGAALDVQLRVFSMIPNISVSAIVPLGSVFVFLISLVLAVIYEKIWHFIDIKCHITERIYKRFKIAV